jgi:hypothetical protein
MGRRSSNSSWETELIGTTAGIALVALVVVMVVIVTLLYLTATEIFKIYRSRATGSSQTSRYLWGALACFLGVLLLAGLLTATTHDGSAGLALSSLGFFCYVLACEYLDYLARRNEPPIEELALSDVASWQPAAELENR